MKVIDFQTKFLSRPYFEALAALSPLSGTIEEKLQRAAKRAGVEPPSASLDDHAARWIDELDRHGVDHAVSCASCPDELDGVAEAAGLSGGRLLPFASVDPLAAGAAEHTGALVRERGFRGIVLSPAVGRYDLAAPEVDAVLAALEGTGATVLVRCGVNPARLRDVLGVPRLFDLRCADPLAVVPAAGKHPRLAIVLSAIGGGFLREALMVGAQCDNVRVDTSYAEDWMKTQSTTQQLADVFERVLGVYGPERVLFATGSSTFPKGWRHDRRVQQREAFGACGLKRDDLDSIFGGNAARLLSLDVSAATPAAARPQS